MREYACWWLSTVAVVLVGGLAIENLVDLVAYLRDPER